MTEEPVKRKRGRPRKNPLPEDVENVDSSTEESTEREAPRIEEAKDGSVMVEVEATEDGMVPLLLLKNYQPANGCVMHSVDGETVNVPPGEKVMAGAVIVLPEEEARRALKNLICDRAGKL